MIPVAILAACSPLLAPAHAQPAPAPAPPAGTLTRPPELLQFVEAPFPPSEAGRTAAVVLAITLRADGTVEDVTVQESAGPAFDEAALAAARQFVFSPAEVDGVPARVRILYQYAFVEQVVAPTTAQFAGVVADRETGGPLPGVRVGLVAADGTQREVVTDEAGRFSFDEVPPGTLVVTLAGERLTPIQTEETFVAGERLEATYEVFLSEPGEAEDDLEILVEAPALKRQAVSTEVSAEEARTVPGTQGDVLRVVENLPGVARASLGTGALVVWGAAPEDTGVYVDGVPVPRLYHDGGLRSVVGSDFVRSVELVPGGYGAAYGRGLGGLVSVSTPRFDEPGWHGSAAADLYDAAASAHGRVGERLSVGLAARRGWVGPLLSAFSPEIEDTFPIPHYTDAQARLGWTIGPGETIDATALLSSDWTRRTAPSPDPARVATEDSRQAFQRLSVRYVRDAGDGSVASLVVFGGADQSSEGAAFGPVVTDIETEVALGGLRASFRDRVARRLQLEVGTDVLVPHTQASRRGSVALPAREGDVRVFGQPPPDQLASDTFTVTTVSAATYGEAELAVVPARDPQRAEVLAVVGGVRFDPYARSVSRATPQVGATPTHGLFLVDPGLEPRLAARLAPATWLTVTAATGAYAQFPAPADLSASFGNPTLPVQRATHRVVGLGLAPLPALTVDLTAFHTRSEDLAMRSDAEQPAAAEALVASGSGRTRGIQAMVRLDRVSKGDAPPSGPYGWLSYTLSSSERRQRDDAAWRPSDYDQRHVLTALGGWQWPVGFELGLRVRVATGFPRTEVVGAYHDSRRDLFQPVFGAQNALRLPTFFQADLRAAHGFELAGSTFDVSFEVQNVTDRDNAEEYVYDADYGERGTIRGLPILPVLGVRWSR